MTVRAGRGGWTARFAARTERMRPSEIRTLLKRTAGSDVISLAGGLPSPATFDVGAFAAAAERALVRDGRRALQYGPTDGRPELRAWVAERTPGATPERVLITSGSQQGLALLAQVLIDPEAPVAVAAPTYMGALRAFDPYAPRWLPVATDADGMRPEALEAALAQRPAFLYVIPDFDNPTGSRMTLERREALLDAAARHDVLVIEDAPYRELRFEGEELPTLHELAPERVAHLGTLSKTLAPGLRLAWVAGPEALIEALQRAKQASDLHTSTFVQAVALEAVAEGALDRRLPELRVHYRARRDVLVDALAVEAGDRLAFEPPQGGMFLWARATDGTDTTRLLGAAVDAGVAFVPGAAFYPAGAPADRLRLSYSLPDDAGLREAARRLRTAFDAPAARP